MCVRSWVWGDETGVTKTEGVASVFYILLAVENIFKVRL